MDEFERGLDRASSKFKSFSSNIESLSSGPNKAYSTLGKVTKLAVEGFKAVESVGKKAGDVVKKGLNGFAAASTAVAGFGAAAVKSGMAFDSSMSKVAAISGATGDEFNALRNKALEMGAKTKFSASEAADAMTYMGMAGWKAGDMISGIEGIMNLAAASGEDLALTSDIVTDALTAFGMAASDSGHLADIMAAASSNANTNVAMLGESFKYVAPVAGALGYSMEDTSLALGLMANSCIKASQAGTSLRTAMTNMASPTKNMAKVMSEYGISLTDADGSMLSLQEVMIQLREKMGGLDEATQVSAASMLFGKEAMSGMLAIINAAPEDFEKLTGAINDCNGAAEEMAATMIDNLQGDLTLLGSAFESLQIAISDSLTPTLREFAQLGRKAMANLLEGFQGGGVSGFMSALSGIVTEGVTMLAEKAPEFASVSIQFIGALGEGLINAGPQILESTNQVISTIITGISTFLSEHGEEMAQLGIGMVRSIFNGFSQAGEVISENIGTFIPLVTEAFLGYHENLFTVGADILGAIGKGLVENKEQLQTMISQTITNMVTALRENASDISDGAIALLEALVGAIQENASLVGESAAEIVANLCNSIGEAAPDLIPAAYDAVLTFAEALTTPESSDALIEGALNLIKGLAEGLMNGLHLIYERGPEIIGNIAQALIENLPEIIEVGIELLAMLGVGMIQGLLMVPKVIGEVVAGIIDGFASLFGLDGSASEFLKMGGDLIGDLLSGISDAWEGIVSFFSGALDGLKSLLSGAWEAIKGTVSTAWDAIKGVFSAAWDGIKAVFNGVSEFFSGVWQGIQDVFSDVVEVLGGFFSDAWDAIKGVWDAVAGFFSDIAIGIQDAFGTATEFLSNVFEEAWAAVSGAWEAATQFFSDLWDDISGAFSDVVDFFGGLFSDAWDAVCSAWDGVTEFFGGVWENIAGVFSNVWDKFKEIGGNIVSGIKDGILSAWDSFIGWIGDKVGGIVTAVKNMLGIHSPSKVFAGIGGNMALGLVEGWDDEYAGIKRQIENGLNFGTTTVGLNANYSNTGRYGAQEALQRTGTGWGNTYVTINSPEAVDGVQAARVWRKEAQRMALGYI